MGKKKNKVSIEGVIKVREAADYLENLAASLRTGVVSVRQDNEILALQVPPLVEFELEAQSRESAAKLRIKLSWEDDGRYGLRQEVRIEGADLGD